MSQMKSRMNVINVLYLYELTGEQLDSFAVHDNFDLSETEFKSLNWIIKKYDALKKVVCKYLKQGWSWNRLAPLERGLLLYGAFEMSFRSKSIVINEIITLAKGFIPGDSYKFINGILDKVAKDYESKK